MNRHCLLALLSAAAFFPTTASAQVTYDSDLGVWPAGGGDLDEGIFTIGPLLSSFTFPGGGAPVTSFDLTTNGRIIPTGAAAPAFAGSLGLFLATPTIAPLWTDLWTFSGAVYWSTNALRTTITFVDTNVWPASSPGFTFQLQLHSDGRIGFLFDHRVFGSPILGLSDGTNSVLGASDLSAAPTSSQPNLHEDFGLFDLTNMAIEFTPIPPPVGAPGGPNGWTTVIGPAGFPPPPIPGFSEDVGKSINRTLTFTPDGGGGYTVARAIPTWFDDTGIGTDLGMMDTLLVTTPPLGFPFTMPGGASTTTVVVEDNGRLCSVAPNGADSSPTVAELLGGFAGAPPSICAFWSNLNTGGFFFPGAGTVSFYADPGGAFAAITWRGIPQSSTSTGKYFTFQAVLRPDDSFDLNYLDMDEYTSFAAIIGCSSGWDGPGTDPGGVHFTDPVNVSNSEGTIYQHWGAAETVDIKPRLSVVGTPTMGGTLDLLARGISSDGTMAQLLLGFWNTAPSGPLPSSPPNLDPDIPLDGIGVEGGVLSTSGDIVLPLTIDPDQTAAFSTPLPIEPALVGVINFWMQVVYLSPTDTSLGVGLTNGAHAFF